MTNIFKYIPYYLLIIQILFVITHNVYLRVETEIKSQLIIKLNQQNKMYNIIFIHLYLKITLRTLNNTI